MKHRCLCWVLGLMLWIPSPFTSARELPEHARELRQQLREKILPYWFDTAQDTTHGGYVLADDLKGKRTATEKQLVTQSRMIWGFAHAHLKGFSTERRNYLRAAEQGYQFLLAHFLDPQYGGYFWTTDLAGKVKDDRKILYGESFVMYALVEYARASGQQEPLRYALNLYRVIQERAYDSARHGWIEHFQRDWQPILDPKAPAQVEVAGYKSANTHLHLMEALTELCAATRDVSVKNSLAEAVDLNVRYFYPKNPGKASFHRQLDWRPVTDPASAGLSYGHNVEFAWLMIHAQQTLGEKPAWPHFYAHLQHALKYGCDHQRGGLYNRGADDQPATQTDKVWWVQSEMLAALTDALKHKPDPAQARVLDQLLHFIADFQADPADGVWLDTVTADGKPKSTGKAHNWKANYHDVRGLVKFIEAFAPSS